MELEILEQLKLHPSTTQDIRQELLSSYRFSPGSRLQEYLRKQKPGILPRVFKFIALLNIFKDLIENTKQFDFKNQAIILCNHEMEHALNVSVLHVTQVKEYMYKQLEFVCEYTPQILLGISSRPFIVRCFPAQTTINVSADSDPPAISKTVTQNVSDENSLALPTYYIMYFQLRKVLCTLSSFPRTKIIFTFKEVKELIGEYIMSKRIALFDYRNPYVCVIDKDPLGEIFQVDAFHYTQLSELLLHNLTIVNG